MFPTGSSTIKPGEPLGAMVFHQDGTWDFRPHHNASAKDLDTMTEFVEFVSFSMSNLDHLAEFKNFQKKSDDEKIREWRRENLKLVYCKSGSK